MSTVLGDTPQIPSHRKPDLTMLKEQCSFQVAKKTGKGKTWLDVLLCWARRFRPRGGIPDKKGLGAPAVTQTYPILNVTNTSG